MKDLDFATLLSPGGELAWLTPWTHGRPDLQMHVGEDGDHEWVEVNRGSTTLLRILPRLGKGCLMLDVPLALRDLAPGLYGLKGKRANFQRDLEALYRNLAQHVVEL